MESGPGGGGNALSVTAASGGVAEIERAEQGAQGGSEGQLSCPGKELGWVGDPVGWDELFPVAQFLHAVVGINAVVVPLGPIATV
jgi:hypothetical protein